MIRGNHWQPQKQRLIRIYKALYYGQFGCTPLLRLKKFLPGNGRREIFLVKSGGSHIAYHSIPKTGCTTVKLMLHDAIGHPLHVSNDIDHLHREATCNVIPENSDNYLKVITLQRGENGLSPLPQLPEFSHAFHFAFVRNPWLRLASCYTDKVFGKRPYRFESFGYCYPRVRFEQMTFADFVRFVCRVPDDLCEPHFRPQSDFIDKNAMDFLGSTENFAKDLREIIARTGLDKRLDKWARMKTNQMQNNTSDYSNLYTSQTRNLVAKKYAKDIEFFGHRFGK